MNTIKALKWAIFPYICLIASLSAQTGWTALTLRHFPLDSEVYLDGHLLQPDETVDEYRTFFVNPGFHHLSIRSEGYLSQSYPLYLRDREEYIEDKLEKPGLPLTQLEELPTAKQPKSVTFSPDGEFLAVASLGSNRGLQIYRVQPFAHLIDLIPPENLSSQTGFVESCWLPGREEVWFSQMNTGMFHVYSTRDWSYLGSYAAGGAWSKVLTVSDDESRVYISHWASERVSEIDTATRKILRSFSTSGIPRGMTFSPDGNTLLVTIFSANAIDSVDLASGNVTTQSYSKHSGAMRHLVSDRARGLHYVTNMQLGLVYALSDQDGQVVNTYRVGYKPNTAEMTADGRYLFVSCRGPNNPQSYLIEGHEFGKVYIVDLEERRVVGWIWGRDQTTGLDVSPDSRYLAFTDFKDDTLELYLIDEDREEP
ncbi:MAG: YncE family protein [Spirochaetales bacterium]|nr:YncE family protein [Spirochaetales bacterium]